MKYIIHPGTVISRSDGDEHFIGAKQLADLYGVDLRDCVVADGRRERGLLPGDYIHLGPRHDGNYSLPDLNSLKKETK